jgi:hypothetical protein
MPEGFIEMSFGAIPEPTIAAREDAPSLTPRVLEDAADALSEAIDRLVELHESNPRTVATALNGRLFNEEKRIRWLALPMRYPK